MKCYRQAKVSW